MHAADVDGGKTLNFFDVDNSLHEKGVPGNTVDTYLIVTHILLLQFDNHKDVDKNDRYVRQFHL